uniref:C-type lectin domain-containing protein n=1 Tax=Myripristis murdjan TaxID=586833 RepID=A0A668AQ53_9TELE
NKKIYTYRTHTHTRLTVNKQKTQTVNMASYIPVLSARIPPTVQSRFCQRCPENWMEINSRCYFLSRGSKSWKESRADCQSKDADLVIISSGEEQRFITGLKDRAWIGLTDEENEGIWKWVDGTAPAKTYWHHQQPDNFLKKEHCVEAVQSYGELHTWNDLDCSTRRHWICEKSVV